MERKNSSAVKGKRAKVLGSAVRLTKNARGTRAEGGHGRTTYSGTSEVLPK